MSEAIRNFKEVIKNKDQLYDCMVGESKYTYEISNLCWFVVDNLHLPERKKVTLEFMQ